VSLKLQTSASWKAHDCTASKNENDFMTSAACSR
jgi:hypothetical protein